jgi:hypothetical protein
LVRHLVAVHHPIAAGRVMELPPGVPMWCPYCGAGGDDRAASLVKQGLRIGDGLWRCVVCRAVFHLHYSRTLRAAPRRGA